MTVRKQALKLIQKNTCRKCYSNVYGRCYGSCGNDLERPKAILQRTGKCPRFTPKEPGYEIDTE
jgi:hypothetical protein